MDSLEDRIERFVRYPHTLEPEERDAIALLTETDATSKRLAAFYRSFYEELDATPDPPTPDSPEGKNGHA